MAQHNTKAAQNRLLAVENEKAYFARINKLFDILQEQVDGEAPPDVLKWTAGEIKAAVREKTRRNIRNIEQSYERIKR